MPRKRAAQPSPASEPTPSQPAAAPAPPKTPATIVAQVDAAAAKRKPAKRIGKAGAATAAADAEAQLAARLTESFRAAVASNTIDTVPAAAINAWWAAHKDKEDGEEILGWRCTATPVVHKAVVEELNRWWRFVLGTRTVQVKLPAGWREMDVDDFLVSYAFLRVWHHHRSLADVWLKSRERRNVYEGENQQPQL
jgi:hypothetical protein